MNNFIKSSDEPENISDNSYWFIFREDEILIQSNDDEEFNIPKKTGLSEKNIQFAMNCFFLKYHPLLLSLL